MAQKSLEPQSTGSLKPMMEVDNQASARKGGRKLTPVGATGQQPGGRVPDAEKTGKPSYSRHKGFTAKGRRAQGNGVLRWLGTADLYASENHPVVRGELMMQEIKFSVAVKSNSESVQYVVISEDHRLPEAS